MDYYQILGLNKNCSNSEIKSAYKKLAIKYHPDRHLDNITKKKCEEQFKQISEAYQVLSDSEKKQNYDLFNHVDFEKLQNPSDIFKSIFESLPSEYIQSYSIFLDKVLNSPELELTNKVFEKYVPENKYYNSVKNMMQFIHQNINQFSNNSFSNNEQHPETNESPLDSNGTQTQVNSTRSQVEPKLSQLNLDNNKISEMVKIKENNNINYQDYHCKNVKNKTDNIVTTIIVTLEEVYKEEFKKIDINRIRKNIEGNYIKEKKTFIIPLFQQQIIFREEADELPNYEIAGDIIINLKITIHHCFKRLKNNNLLLSYDVSLYEYYFGTTKKFTFLDSSTLVINSGPNLHKSNIKKITSKGLPMGGKKYGDLYIQFNLKLNNIDLNDNIFNKFLFTYFNNSSSHSKVPKDISQPLYLNTDTCDTSMSDLSSLSSSSSISIECSQDTLS